VQGVEKRESVFQARTTDRDYEAKNVVIATGLYQSPKIPAFAAGIPADILQLHSMQYRNPSVLPHGAVLVIGTGQSGAQIAEELYQSGRKVYLSIGSAGRVPRRYSRKGTSVTWFTRMGMFDTQVQTLKSPAEKVPSTSTDLREERRRESELASIFPRRCRVALGTSETLARGVS